MTRVTGAEVRWYERFENSSKLIIEVSDREGLISRDEPIWERHGRYVTAHKPILAPDGQEVFGHELVDFVALDPAHPPSGGALGGRFRLRDGTWVESPGGWSSRAGAINEDPVTEFGLPDYVLDVALRVQGERGLLAGHVTLPVALEAVHAFLPGVYLVEEQKFANVELYYTPSVDPYAVQKAGGEK